MSSDVCMCIYDYYCRLSPFQPSCEVYDHCTTYIQLDLLDVSLHWVCTGAPDDEWLNRPITASDSPFLRANVRSVKAHVMGKGMNLPKLFSLITFSSVILLTSDDVSMSLVSWRCQVVMWPCAVDRCLHTGRHHCS